MLLPTIRDQREDTVFFAVRRITVLLGIFLPFISAGQPDTVEMGDNFFSPETLAVKAGDTVVWVNNGNADHTSTSGDPCNGDGIWDSGTMTPGETFSYTFNDTGDFPYFCIPHCSFGVGMTGFIEVQGKSYCDSVISPTACDSFTVPSGDTTYTSSGTYSDTVANSSSCDTAFTIELSIRNPSRDTIAPEVCDRFTVPSEDTTYTQSGTYHDTLTNDADCDSIIRIELTIDPVDTAVTRNGATLKANESNASYQWLDCDNGHAAIQGATDQEFTPNSNGDYAVEVSKGGCTDSSHCHSVTTIGIIEQSFGPGFKVYPNPTKGRITIDLGAIHESVTIQVRDLEGRLIDKRSQRDLRQMKITPGNSKGVYLLEIRADSHRARLRVVRE